ncbi:hypothetical protein Bca52824_019474 [Brassica carinata]|uniref:Uncharacterized protein n=1 Tax=Brassica carinata TaxID=52824 RepID=A0A8X7VSI8_BRACI|nr:hypothetical protein Bca52824_019474 [Brassica carinata]
MRFKIGRDDGDQRPWSFSHGAPSSHPLMKKLVTFILSTLFLTTTNSETQCRRNFLASLDPNDLPHAAPPIRTHSSTIPRAVSQTVVSSSTSLVLVPTLPIACRHRYGPVLKTLMSDPYLFSFF